MTLSVCPIATVHAPIERVWALLAHPASYAEWWDARTERIEPPGPATPGQVIAASASGLGRRWPVTLRVVGVDDARHALDLRTALPLGITLDNHLLCQSIDTDTTRVTFG